MDRKTADGQAREFLKYELVASSILAAFQRNKVYQASATEKERAEFRGMLRLALHELESEYATEVSSERHEANIESLSNRLSGHFFLAGHRFRIGASQKVLNLYLKYLWCLGEIPEPPHCLFDARVIGLLGLPTNWTELDSIVIYRDLVRAARARAAQEGRSLPMWELSHFNAWRP